MIPKTIIHLLSGGLDSTVMLYDLIAQEHRVHAVLFAYGQRHVRELDFAKYHCERTYTKFTLISLPQLRGSDLTDGTGSWVVPNRNQILLSHAVNLAVAAKADAVTYACNADDAKMFPDCGMEFVEAMNRVVRLAELSVEICTPYIDKAKWWIGGKARDLKVPVDKTWSCYRDGEKPCGECPACVKREAALK